MGYNVSVPHRLGRQTAQERLEQFLESVRRQYAADIEDVRGQWDDNRLAFGFSTRGLAVNGTLVVEEQEVLVYGPLPLIAMMFRGRIEQTIREELERLLG